MVVKYILHPGYVFSRNDGDRHFIGAAKLARLYGVRLGECIDAAHMKGSFLELKRDSAQSKRFIHLYPRNDGDYTLPVKEDA